MMQAKGNLVSNELLNLSVSAMLGAVILNEVISPLAVRFALVRAGEATKL